MNSRERVLAALEHREADRVPIDLGGTRQSGIAASAYHALKRHLGFDSPTRVFDLYQILAEIERPVLERFGADVVGLNRPDVVFGIVNENFKPWTLPDGTPVEVPGRFEPAIEPDGDLVIRQDGRDVARMPADGYYFDRVEKFPGAAHADVDSLGVPLLSAELCGHFHHQAEALFQNTDMAVIAPLGPPFELFYGLGTGDFAAWMCTLATEPDYVDALFTKLVDAWIENLRRFTDAVGDRVQIIQVNDDFGMQHAPFLSEKMFRNSIMPYYKRGMDWIHANTEMKIFLHSDGAIRPLLPAIIEMGVDVLNPVQTSAAGMDAAELKREFGDRLVFWGGALDCQKTLPFGTPDEVAREVREHVETFKPGGGYVFASVHNIQAKVPPENVIAMFDAAQAAGAYD